MSPPRIVRVGIIGCGEVTQVIHIPTLNHLSALFKITYLCDVSPGALNFCKQRVVAAVPATTPSAEELCASPEVDVVFVANSEPFHTQHTILGLKHGKTIFVEKPMATCVRDADAIIAAEKESSGTVMVEYMRRYAAGYLDAVKEIGGLGEIKHAVVRDLIGPNAVFVGQSATFPQKFFDFSGKDSEELWRKMCDNYTQALQKELGIEQTPDNEKMWRMLNALGSHDLSAMREALGMPQRVIGASLCKSSGAPFWSALLRYPGFTVSYESGIHNVGIFDASIEVFGVDKIIKLRYDTPYVKGLPITMQIRENTPEGGFKETMVRRTYEDAYTQEMKELYALVVEGKATKTTAEDARQDLKIFGMIIKAGQDNS